MYIQPWKGVPNVAGACSDLSTIAEGRSDGGSETPGKISERLPGERKSPHPTGSNEPETSMVVCGLRRCVIGSETLTLPS
jgi:hypothetical protein